MQVADDFASQDPEIVDVFADCLSGERKLDQMLEERSEALDNFLAGRDVLRESHPALWPFVEVFAAVQPIQRAGALRPGRGLRYGTGLRFPGTHRHGTDHNSKPVSSFSGIRV